MKHLYILSILSLLAISINPLCYAQDTAPIITATLGYAKGQTLTGCCPNKVIISCSIL